MRLVHKQLLHPHRGPAALEADVEAALDGDAPAAVRQRAQELIGFHMPTVGGPRVAVVLKGYPRLSETFIAQEIAGLERAASRSRSSRCAIRPTRRAIRCTTA